MSFIKSLFSKSKPNPDNDKNIDEHLEFLKTLRMPAIALSKTDKDVFSRIGGLPCLPEGVEWPEWNGHPLQFLAQLDLSEVPDNCKRDGLPSSGVLYFFYNEEQETWGFDPKDKGSWKVIYSNSPADQLSIREVPQGVKENFIYGEKTVAFIPVQTFPDWQDDRVQSLALNNKQHDQYIDVCSAVFQNKPEHHLFGYPSPVQGNNMELECQLASNGIYCGNPSCYSDPRVKVLEAGKSEWVLLFQIDTDDDVEMMWGDCGRLYFWIRKDDLNKANFDDCWMILQCG